MTLLTLTEATYQAIREHGEETYPNECCGILLGHAHAAPAPGAPRDPPTRELPTNEVIEAIRAGNTRTDSAHNRYNIAPQELVRAQREAREKGLDIVGFYHSHPDHPAHWSSTDFAEAHWLGCSYIITAIEKGKATTTNSFLLTGPSEEEKQFHPQPIQLRP
ncbi:MAG TPA: M67 family metallopeptidase [Acidisarcina sp.]